jgi:hypothetical protein
VLPRPLPAAGEVGVVAHCVREPDAAAISSHLLLLGCRCAWRDRRSPRPWLLTSIAGSESGVAAEYLGKNAGSPQYKSRYEVPENGNTIGKVEGV